jgi:serine/threonine protein kinase
MLAAMSSSRNEDFLATSPQAPSLTGSTHICEPIPGRLLDHASEQDSHPPPLPTQLCDPGRYHFLGEHGLGGLGRVSRAHDRELGRDVAIKELLARGNANEMRFLREVLITARLEHPGIVPVHEAGRWADGTPFYAMKLVAGRPLRDLIVERTTIEDRIGLLHHVIAVADAIAYAHGRNIIHRDLKPSNVIVGDFGETIVIDWGLAKDLTSAEVSATGDGPIPTTPDDDLTSTGSVLGTRSYMAPEQERGEPVDQRADVFAIGVMLWELCSLQKVPPSDVHARHRVLRRTGIDEDLATIIDKALDPDRERRYLDAAALA